LNELQIAFNEADVDGNHCLDLEEFKEGNVDQTFKEILDLK
jgi:hypothetical protein